MQRSNVITDFRRQEAERLDQQLKKEQEKGNSKRLLERIDTLTKELQKKYVSSMGCLLLFHQM